MGRDAKPSSGNVFADLGLPEPAEDLVRARLALQLGDAVRKLGLTQVETARRLGVDQPKVSALLRGRLAGFSTERLMRFLIALGRDVDIVVRRSPPSRRVGRLQVVAG